MVPAIRFHECPKQKTRTQRRTLFPLFDETFDLWVWIFAYTWFILKLLFSMQSINLSFTINLSNFILHSVIKHEPHRLHDSYILMTVKDNSFIGGGIFLGEALLKLEDIPLSQIDQGLSELPQIQLPLTKPSCHGRMGRNIFQLDNYRIKCENVKPGILMRLFSFQIRISC